MEFVEMVELSLLSAVNEAMHSDEKVTILCRIAEHAMTNK